MTQVTPLISLQAPKDVSLGDIEAELSQVWQSYNTGSSGTPVATRAATFTLVIFEPAETQQLLAGLGFYTGAIDGIDGARTEAALKQAQQQYGLRITGKADAETLMTLREQFAKRQAEGSVQTEQVTEAVHATMDSSASGFADAIASQNPCRIISICTTPGQDEGISAQVSAYCPVRKQSQSSLVCCEYITLKGSRSAVERSGELVSSLLIGHLPKFLWWKASPDMDQELFQQLSEVCDCVILDSSGFTHPEEHLLRMNSLLQGSIYVADLNWRRLAAWQELTAEAFDAPERRAAIREVDQVTIDYEKGNPAQALMFLGWLASRLRWRPVSCTKEKDFYDLSKIQFVVEDSDRTIEAELAGIPTADVGEVPGDLVGLRLTSTNPEADCCTVLCSETMGCMRMEAGGWAQSCYIQQVTPLSEQKAEYLLSQQLQRWGRELLYEESMEVTTEIIHLLMAL